jgi:signal peptidase I
MSTRWMTLFMLACAGCVGAASRLSAASLSDWVEGARIAQMFVSAGISAKSYFQPTTKMMPNLAEGDVLLADLRQEGVEPQRGEIVVTAFDAKTVYIDRVIGLPGDRVAFRAGHIILNGTEIAQAPAGTLDYDRAGIQETLNLSVETLPGARPYKIGRVISGGGYLDNVAEITVPSGRLYLVGDNRDNSVDSRTPSRGAVPITSVIGRVVYRMRPNAGWLVPRESVPALPKE